MEFEIINKTKGLVRDYSACIQRGEKWYSSQVRIEPLHLMILTEVENDDKTLYIEANINWCYSLDTLVSKKFEYSEEGFNQACEWLDGMRVEFAKRLL